MMEEAAEKTEISADVTALTSASDLSWALTGVGYHLFNALLVFEFFNQNF